ncbi:unnamed protein product [Rotaria sp. Silwood1]|nr:unnamed protein product [Rotaria sp. Silwood1]
MTSSETKTCDPTSVKHSITDSVILQPDVVKKPKNSGKKSVSSTYNFENHGISDASNEPLPDSVDARRDDFEIDTTPGKRY